MAICFMLVVNFGDDAEAAQAAARIAPKPWVLHAGAHRIPLHRPMLAKVGSYIELSILPVAVSWGCGLDGSLPRFQLTAAELTELGHQLYELLAQFHGYVAAKVGWDRESLLDPAELRGEWSDELNDGSIHGLVLCEKLHAELDPSTDYEVFQPGYRWIPYRGEGPSSLTAG
ncbi:MULTISPECIES: hypothetical protein [unclassified Streptomyces]|uniref:hypothetical protein n=1 Tax=unclassified Streptomyces TaxID=2593676 RepID=UPI002DD9DD9A|nr:hypothetical protein [Streptomyces sp. NBC_01445]WSE08720.1 hypothetical protein OG574_38370 [Streptomyces sp. NBC_01445]